MRPLLVPVLLVLTVFLAPGTRARAEPSSGCEVPATPQTAMQDGALGRATHVLLGQVGGVKNVRGLMLAHVRPVRTIKGSVPPGGPLTVLIRGPRPTGDRERPSAPYLTEASRGRYVFFLRRNAEGVAFSLLTMFDAAGDLGAQKLAALIRHAELLAMGDDEARGRQTVAWLLESQRANGTWTRVHTARELSHLAGLRPDLFDDRVRTTLRSLLKRGTLPAQRSWLVQAAKAVGDTTPVPVAPTPPGAGLGALLEAVATPKARIEVIRSFLHRGGAWTEILGLTPQEPAAVRLFVVTTLADAGYVTALAKIRALYAFEDDSKVLAAIVRATGLLGSGEDVAWVADRVGNLRTRREALFALARIRTPEAMDALARTVTGTGANGGTSDDIRPLVEYLRSPVFAEVEAAAGRTVGPERRR